MTRLLLTAAACAAVLPLAPATALTFTPGSLVVSIYGNGDGSGPYGDNQASPIVLRQLSTTGAVLGDLVLPQTASTANGIAQSAISGEYGSSSEGFLQRSGDGKSLTIMGYGVNAAEYNANATTKYGNAALAQSTSLTSQTAYTPAARVVAQVFGNGAIDTSTAVYNVFDTNNPRSAWTQNGATFYISGQGVKGDTTNGVFSAARGASGATALYTASNTRDVQMVNGQLYVSSDVKNGPTSVNVLANGTVTPLAGIGPTVTLASAQQGNGVNASRSGSFVYLSPEQFFFANATTLYVADGGSPKGGNANAAGIGDGGLQKWTFANGAWSLAYTLSAGLNLVNNAGAAGTTGLFGLAGQVLGDTVSFYATSYTIGDLDQSYVYAITDSLSATAPAAGEAFSTIYTAAAGTKVKGIAFAPDLAAAAGVPEPAGWATMLAGFGMIGAALRRRRPAQAVPA